MAKSRDIRRDELVKFVNRNGSVSFEQLKEAFPNFSEMTLRLDLRDLDAEHRIIRAYGGARSIEHAIGVDVPFSERIVRDFERKDKIARKAVELLRNGGTIFLDSGSTPAIFCRAMPADLSCTIFTANLSCVEDLARLEKSPVIVLGGDLNRPNLCVEGSRTIEAVRELHIGQLFLSATSYMPSTGFTCELDAQARLKQALIRQSDEVIMLADATKIGGEGTFGFATLKDIGMLVVDEPDELPAEFLAECKAASVKVI